MAGPELWIRLISPDQLLVGALVEAASCMR